MRLIIAAVGRLKAGPEQDLFNHYLARLTTAGRSVSLDPVSVAELPESRDQTPTLRQDDEALRLLAAVRGTDACVLLDSRGKGLTSEAFADWLRSRRDHGCRTTGFLIGGPDGHGAAARQGADLILSFGAITLPHGLARVVLAEQLYRAATILAGHPYHRG